MARETLGLVLVAGGAAPRTIGQASGAGKQVPLSGAEQMAVGRCGAVRSRTDGECRRMTANAIGTDGRTTRADTEKGTETEIKTETETETSAPGETMMTGVHGGTTTTGTAREVPARSEEVAARTAAAGGTTVMIATITAGIKAGGAVSARDGMAEVAVAAQNGIGGALRRGRPTVARAAHGHQNRAVADRARPARTEAGITAPITVVGRAARAGAEADPLRTLAADGMQVAMGTTTAIIPPVPEHRGSGSTLRLSSKGAVHLLVIVRCLYTGMVTCIQWEWSWSNTMCKVQVRPDDACTAAQGADQAHAGVTDKQGVPVDTCCA